MDKKFFEVFEISPLVKKGDTYISNKVRFAEVVAEEDIYWEITPEIIIGLEQLLGTFTLTCNPTHQDETDYIYSTKVGESDKSISRKNALLSYFIKYSDTYKTLVQALFRK